MSNSLQSNTGIDKLWTFICGVFIMMGVVGFYTHAVYVKKYYFDHSYRNSFRSLCAYRSVVHLINCLHFLIVALFGRMLVDSHSGLLALYMVGEVIGYYYGISEIFFALNRFAAIVFWKEYDNLFSYRNCRIMFLIPLLVALPVEYYFAIYLADNENLVSFECFFSFAAALLASIINAVTFGYLIKYQLNLKNGQTVIGNPKNIIRKNIKPYIFSILQTLLTVISYMLLFIGSPVDVPYYELIYYFSGCVLKDFLEGVALFAMMRTDGKSSRYPTTSAAKSPKKILFSIQKLDISKLLEILTDLIRYVNYIHSCASDQGNYVEEIGNFLKFKVFETSLNNLILRIDALSSINNVDDLLDMLESCLTTCKDDMQEFVSALHENVKKLKTTGKTVMLMCSNILVFIAEGDHENKEKLETTCKNVTLILKLLDFLFVSSALEHLEKYSISINSIAEDLLDLLMFRAPNQKLHDIKSTIVGKIHELKSAFPELSEDYFSC